MANVQNYPPETDFDGPTAPHKTAMIEDAVARYGLKSALDVGGCWRVNAGYAFHALQQPGMEWAAVLDGQITSLTRKRAAGTHLSMIEGDLGDRAYIAELPKADAAIIYDVLLHQVNPNWDEFLALYAEKVDHFIIYNQDFATDHTVRFIDKGPAWYQENVPGGERAPEWFSKHDEICPWIGKPWRDVHHYWQWGIARGDLIAALNRLGFKLDWSKNFGKWSDEFPLVELNGYLFSRARSA